MENVRLVDLHPSVVMGFTSEVLRLTRRGSCVLCLYACIAVGPFSLSMIVESSCQAGPHCTSHSGLPSMWYNGCMCLLLNPSFVHVSICCWVSISGLRLVTRYVVWLCRCMWYCISSTSYAVFMVSLGVMYVYSWYVALRLFEPLLLTLVWVVIVS